MLIQEKYSENAYSLRDAYIGKTIDIIVPSLFHYEVLNAIKYSKAYSWNELETISETLENYRFGVFNFTTNFAKIIVSISTKYNITMYDASYVALASLTNSKFYTSDEKLIKAVRLPFVCHIKDFK